MNSNRISRFHHHGIIVTFILRKFYLPHFPYLAPTNQPYNDSANKPSSSSSSPCHNHHLAIRLDYLRIFTIVCECSTYLWLLFNHRRHQRYSSHSDDYGYYPFSLRYQLAKQASTRRWICSLRATMPLSLWRWYTCCLASCFKYSYGWAAAPTVMVAATARKSRRYVLHGELGMCTNERLNEWMWSW